jgi:hypothetical protein
MAKKRKTSHERAKDNADASLEVFHHVERFAGRWWNGWRQQAHDAVDMSKAMLEGDYTGGRFVQDATALWINFAKTALCMGPDLDSAIELEIDAKSEDSDIDGVHLARAPQHAPHVSEVRHSNGTDAIPPRNFKIWVVMDRRPVLYVRLIDMKGVSAALPAGEYRGKVQLDGGKSVPITVLHRGP